MEDKIKNLRKNLAEEDLLRQQSEFLKEAKDPKFQPAVSKLYKSDQVIKDQESRPKYDEPSVTNVFMPLEIVERDTSNVTVQEIEKNIAELVQMDDNQLKCNLNNFKDASKKKSLFSQYMENKRQKINKACSSTDKDLLDSNQDSTKISLINGTGLVNPDSSNGMFKKNIEDARKEIEILSKENDDLLKSLNDNQKKELLQNYNLSPNLLNFIKSKNSSKKLNESSDQLKKGSLNNKLKNEQPNQPINVQKDYVNLSLLSGKISPKKETKIQYIDEEEVRKNKWLNMDKIEKEKLEWMKPLIENERKKELGSTNSIEGKAARFNFEGDLVLREDLDYRLGLHHHSEQETAAGYTINELIGLTQSKYIPQRILAINTLANIFRRMHRGYFDICFDKSLSIELIEKTELLILLRRLLDDSNASIKLVTIKCIHGLVCNTIYDEFCLDRLFCSMELGVEIPKLCFNEIENEKELKDEQLCKLDVISCLIRMNILPRLRYLLDNLMVKQEDPIVIDNIMDILIRISRHSSRSCKELINTPYLIKSLINNFVKSTTNIQNWKALKIIRILFTTDKDHIKKIKNEFPELWTGFRNYLITNPLNEDSKDIYLTIIEVLRVWRVLLVIDNEMNETTEQFIELVSNIRNCLSIKILVNNSFDLHYISNLLHCLAYVIQKNPSLEHFFTPLIQDLTFQWFREILNNNELPKLDGCLAISSSLLYLNCSSIDGSQFLNYILKPILDSDQLFNKLIDQLLKNSPVLNFKEYHNSIYRDSKALPSYGSIYFGGSTIKLNQLLNEDSIIFLVGPLIGLAAKHQLKHCLEQFIYHSNIKIYLDKIVKQIQKSSNWTIFELIEFNPVSQLILWERNILNKNKYFDHSLSILTSVGDIQLKRSLCEYVFDVKQYKSIYDKINENNKLDQLTDQLIKSSISFFSEIKKLFSKFCQFEDRTWIFDPLVKLYKLQLDPNYHLVEDELVAFLISWLNYLVLVYNLKPNYLWSFIEPKILFVYLSGIFLFKNGLFLNDELLKILKYFLTNLITNHQIHFDCYEEKIPEPFNSIGDHFNQLCSNYKTDSYGNIIFSNYILCFLTQRSDKIFRKKLLNEHAGCLSYFILTKQQLLIKLEHLTNPIETDLTIIESYIRILMAKDIIKERNPLIYEIACTHVTKSLFDDLYSENRLQNSELARKLINCLKLSNNKQLKEHLHVLD